MGYVNPNNCIHRLFIACPGHQRGLYSVHWDKILIYSSSKDMKLDKSSKDMKLEKSSKDMKLEKSSKDINSEMK